MGSWRVQCINIKNKLEDSSDLTILTQSFVMTASVEMKSSEHAESESPLQGEMVKVSQFNKDITHMDLTVSVRGHC